MAGDCLRWKTYPRVLCIGFTKLKANLSPSKALTQSPTESTLNNSSKPSKTTKSGEKPCTGVYITLKVISL